jgi:ketosteroid isomerase-like protein
MSDEGNGAELTQKDVDTVLAGYERWNAGELDALSSLFAEDITYQNAPEWPGQRAYHGAAAVTSFLANEVAKIIALRPVEIISTETTDSEILIELQARTRGFLSGLDMDSATLWHLALVEKGKVKRVRVYLTKAEALEAARTGEG